MAEFDWVIAGAGFTGAVLAERIASVLDERVLVVDRRDHIAGNAYDHVGPEGLLLHKYGPHIFHTNSEKVWRYLSRFTDWRPYYHRVLGVVDGNLVPIPFNLNSIEQCFPRFLSERLAEKLVGAYGLGAKIPILKLKQSADADFQLLAGYVYDNVFKRYTEKQWGIAPEDLDPGVTARVPVVVSRDDRYFHDRYQAMPANGYTALFQRLLDHPRITVALSTTFAEAAADNPGARAVFTGPIDEYFNYSDGALPYRSLAFRRRVMDEPLIQKAGTVNYPNEFDFTRITEIKHLTGEKSAQTVLIEEYPEPYVAGKNDPYYPIPTPDNARRLAPYLQKAKALEGKVWFAGRLGDYAYYNMDQACARALSLFEKQIERRAPLLEAVA